jgi:predicted branched-subunit amino acid permease
MTAPRDMTPGQAFWAGLKIGAPFVLVVAPFGAVFGVVATEAGLDIVQTLVFSIAVIAGAAQLTAVELMVQGAPTFIVLLTALAVNLRMAMYSASLAPHLGAAPVWQRALMSYLMVDQAYAIGVQQFEQHPDMPVGAKVGYYFGAVILLCPTWYLATLAGALLGGAIPPSLPVGFAVPIAFLALIGPMLRTLAHMVAAIVSVAGALIFAFVPYNLGLMIAAILAMGAGALVELWLIRRGRWS